MKRAIALAGVIGVGVALLAAPAMGDGPRKTELVKDGKTVDTLFMRTGAVDQMWVLDNRNILLRDPYRDFYLVSFTQTCDWIHKPENFRFVPALGGNVLASRPYEARSKDERICDVASIRTVMSREEAKAIIGR